ncbi:hypothetical protein E3J49_07600 [Candidatus Bathyarchaeota archaeon]|nr:MAG: hypothetical protein E3J49_07600 [Candidatus Bathyarchaeota archaeon]
MQAKKKRVNRINPRVIPYAFGALALAICGFIAYNLVFMVNVVVMTIALYVACSIVVGRELKNLLNVFIISFLTVIISDLCFAFLQPFIALFIFFFVLLVAVRYSLIKDHDSGWFGALCATVLGLIFLLPIAIILVIVQLFVF